MMADAPSGLPKGVSVIMPVHSGGAFLLQAIESVLGQELDAEWELVIALDRPEADCVAVLDHIESPRIRTVKVLEPGVANAHNAGLYAAKFDLVAVMHSDDVMLPGRLAGQMKMLREHSELVGVGGQVDLIDESGRTLGPARFAADAKAVRSGMPFACPIAHPTSMYRTEVARRVGGYREQFAPAEDLDLWLRLLDIGEMANTPAVVLRYRRHSGQLSQSRKAKQAEAKYMALQAARLRSTLGGDDQMATWPEVRGYSRARLNRDIRFELALDRLARARLSGRFLGVPLPLLTAFLARPSATIHHAMTFTRNALAQRLDNSSKATESPHGQIVG